VTSCYNINHFRPPRTGPDPSAQAKRLMAVRFRGAHPERLQSNATPQIAVHDHVKLILERGEPTGSVVDVRKDRQSGQVIDARVQLANGKRLWRGMAALEKL
jgi:hypothetical protein